MSSKTQKIDEALLEQALIDGNADKQAVLDELERTYWRRTGKRLLKDWRLYALLLPLVLIFLFWKYFPLYGLVGAFKAESSTLTVWQKEFAGLEWFKVLMFGDQKAAFWSAFRNTFLISFYGLLFGFPMPIIIALFFNEIKSNAIRGTMQVFVYLPRFVSLVVTTTLIMLLLKRSADGVSAGVLTRALRTLGIIPESAVTSGVMYQPQYFRPIYIISGIWENAGYDSIVFFAAIIAISPTSYEAAQIDGASKMAQMRYVVLPGMASTIIIMLILRIGGLLNVGYEKVLLLMDPATKSHAQVVSSYVAGIANVAGDGTDNKMSLGSAADLIAALMSMILVLGANKVSRKTSETTLY